MDLEKIAGLVKIIEDSSLKEFTYKDPNPENAPAVVISTLIKSWDTPRINR